MPTSLPTLEEYEALVAERDGLRGACDALQGELRVRTVERDLLQERLRHFLRQLFAARSEARGCAQQELFLNEAEALAAPAPTPAQEVDASVAAVAPARKPRGRRPLDPALPREIIRHELPARERICAHDGATLIEIGVETSEQLDIIPQRVRVIEHQRVKYACPCCDQSIRVTRAPARIIPKGLLTASALAWVVSAKYQDALPLYRQAALLGRFGGELSRATLAASVVRVGAAVQPIVNLLRDHLLDSPLIQGDETPVQVLKEPGRAAQTQSYLWVQMNGTGPPVRLFSYRASRSAATAAELYAGVGEGCVLMTDGYAAYDGLAHTHALTHLGCWAHARRYFIEAQATLPRERRAEHPVSTFLARIGELFAIEAQAAHLTDAQRLERRTQHARPILDQLAALLLTHRAATLPQSLFGKALHYLSHQWPKLVRYVDNGAWPISNNACENLIRPFAVGRRNWLFCDTVGGAQASANLYSLIETCKANGVDAYRYLMALFEALPAARTADEFEALLPWNLTLTEAA